MVLWEPQQNSADRIHNFGEVILKADKCQSKVKIDFDFQNSSTTLPVSERSPSHHRPAPSTTQRSWQRQRLTAPCRRTPSPTYAGIKIKSSKSVPFAFSFYQADPFAPQRIWQLPHLLTRPCGGRACLQQGCIWITALTVFSHPGLHRVSTELPKGRNWCAHDGKISNIPQHHHPYQFSRWIGPLYKFFGDNSFLSNKTIKDGCIAPWHYEHNRP